MQDGPAPKVLLADKGYDADCIREDMERRGATAIDIRRERVSRMKGFRHWRWHLDEMFVDTDKAQSQAPTARQPTCLRAAQSWSSDASTNSKMPDAWQHDMTKPLTAISALSTSSLSG